MIQSSYFKKSSVSFKPLVIFSLSLIFMFFLILSSGLLNTVFPYSDTPQNHDETSLKWKYFTEHKDDYDIIFIGGSVTHFGVIPKLFDEFMLKEGSNIKSFNFGIQGANASQVDFYLQKILAINPANLKWIFIDCAFDLYIVEFPRSLTDIYWHTPQKTIESFQLTLETNESWKTKAKKIYVNFQSFFYRWLGIARVSNWWDEKILGLSLTKTDSLGSLSATSEDKIIEESGYYAIDWREDFDNWKKRFFNVEKSNKYQKDLQEELAKIQSFSQQDMLITDKNSHFQGIRIVKNIVSRIEHQNEHGSQKIEPIFVIPPTLEINYNNSAMLQAYNLGYISTLFAFNKPNIFANLFQLDRRVDAAHLNHQGAKEYTLSLAEEFSQHLKNPTKI